MNRSIAHPTDFSANSSMAFAHAFRLAIEFRCRLDLVHVRSPTDHDSWVSFPHVRETLARWGLLDTHAPIEEIETRLGVTVRKIEVRHADSVTGVAQYLVSHRPDLVVVATQGRAGLSRWLSGSVAENIARETHLPTLFIGPDAQPFVETDTGLLRLDSALLPVASQPDPRRALDQLRALFQPLAPTLYPLHVGDTPPSLLDTEGAPIPLTVVTRGGVVDTIIEMAERTNCSLIAMPTAGHQGFLDAFRGSTTEQVLHRAPCPVLALPAGP